MKKAFLLIVICLLTAINISAASPKKGVKSKKSTITSIEKKIANSSWFMESGINEIDLDLEYKGICYIKVISSYNGGAEIKYKANWNIRDNKLYVYNLSAISAWCNGHTEAFAYEVAKELLIDTKERCSGHEVDRGLNKIGPFKRFVGYE